MTRKAKTRNARKGKPSLPAPGTPDQPRNQPKASRRWLVWLLAGCCLVGAGLATYYLVDYVLWPRIPRELVGKWQVSGGPQNGVILEFQANGAFQATLMEGIKGGVVFARAEVDGHLLHIVSENRETGQQITKTHTIKKLTENELYLEDPTGSVIRHIRLK
jgi:uncharacterized protein (TIGR03066 family)